MEAITDRGFLILFIFLGAFSLAIFFLLRYELIKMRDRENLMTNRGKSRKRRVNKG